MFSEKNSGKIISASHYSALYFQRGAVMLYNRNIMCIIYVIKISSSHIKIKDKYDSLNGIFYLS